ncbi:MULTISPECIES: aromatic amino acid exporter YddG [Pacificibacter]|uniref:aromatic amino acid exporter YddG n=1 Tax=Pacificibacter TaxID=1042323 RepID=UPI001C083EF2|nr:MULTISPECIES: EamA family transporter [Pacificibacter]MBU2934678.1 EamA family transporter [Pacificibacter marinus]MDO6616880.1 EamA family transporter [Pacificibacter sp. 1_MG-2023]
MSQRSATFIGFIAIILWSMLALFTVGTDPVPPFQLNALCFSIGGIIGLAWIATTKSWADLKGVPLSVYGFGTLGLFGYHFLYFSALRAAPPAEAGLIAYLWPLLIVLFSGLLPGERLRLLHIVGAVISFVGASLIVAAGAEFEIESLLGYGLALACAFTWSAYSVLSRRLGDIPTASVTVFCLATALLSAIAHVFLETTAWPTAPIGWLSILALGMGPVGAAFYVWDIGVKHGNIQILGTASYAAPLMSTLILVVFGVTDPKGSLIFSAVLITLGAGLAAYASRQTD